MIINGEQVDWLVGLLYTAVIIGPWLWGFLDLSRLLAGFLGAISRKAVRALVARRWGT